MKENSAPIKRNLTLSFFELFSVFWIVAAVIFLSLGLLGIFKLSFLVSALVLLLLIFVHLIRKKLIRLEKMKKDERIFFFALIVFAFLLCLFSTPTIFGGRDEGSLSSAAILLSQDHSFVHKDQLTQSLHQLYGTGKALNFPGFNYTKDGAIVSQFLPGYTAWLGAFFSLGHLTALKFANLLPLVTFLFSFYLVGKRLIKKNSALLATLILATAVPLVILFQFTLTEIFFAALLWFALHLLLKYLADKTSPNYWLIFLPLALTLFVRIEAAGIIFFLFLVLLFSDFKNIKKPIRQLPFLLLGLVFIIVIAFNPSFFVSNLKGVADNFLPFLSEKISHQSSVLSAEQETTFSLLPDDWKNFYLIKVFANYNLILWFGLSVLFIIYLLKRKSWIKLIPFFLFSPTLIYLLDANISLDHPWMLRRFIFTLIPLFILYGLFFLSRFFSKRSSFLYSLIIFLALAVNLWQSAPFIMKSQNQALFSVLDELATRFSSDDLVLVSQKSSGSGWLLFAEPLRNAHGIPAVYFFRPSDLTTLSQLNFTNLYLLTSPEEQTLFKDIPKEKIAEIDFDNQQISTSRQPLEQPTWLKNQARFFIYRIK